MMHRRPRRPMSVRLLLVSLLLPPMSSTRGSEAASTLPTCQARDSTFGARTVCFSASPIGCLSEAGFGVGKRVSRSSVSSGFGGLKLGECGVGSARRGRGVHAALGVVRRPRSRHRASFNVLPTDMFEVSSSMGKGCYRGLGGAGVDTASKAAAGAFGRGRGRLGRVRVESGRSSGERNDPRDDGGSVNGDAGDSSVVIEDAAIADARGSEDIDAVTTSAAAAVEPQRDEVFRNVMDPLDYAYAVMPQIQESLKEASGKEGTGAGYEDVRVGFYRDTNLKPMNWKDAMVSMKPGSGTAGLKLDRSSGAPHQSQARDERFVAEGSPKDGQRAAVLGGGVEGGSVAKKEDMMRPKQTYQNDERGGNTVARVGTRYGGPIPGTHGPWRWRQLVKGSALEKKLKAEIASFPSRLPRRLRRYYRNKVVWVTGADHGLGERLAINLTVNGAKVILSGTNLQELERVQRLCILAWMKAVNWEIVTAFLERLTRLDRAVVLPLDVRDDFILRDAVSEAEDMLRRPIDMVFNCAGVSTVMGRDAAQGSSSAAGALGIVEAMDVNLWGAVGLTKAILPSMVDRQEGHVVVIAGAGAGEGGITAGAEVASLKALRGYFDSLRAEVARDNVKVTVVRHLGSSRDGVPAPSSGALSADVTARRILAAVSRGRQEVFVERRAFSVMSRLGIGGARRRAL